MVLRFPTLLDRYLGRTYLGLFALVVAAFSSIYALAEFMDLFDDVQRNKVKGRVVLHFYAYHTPWIVHWLLCRAGGGPGRLDLSRRGDHRHEGGRIALPCRRGGDDRPAHKGCLYTMQSHPLHDHRVMD
jgi:hypothetical protein